jgi:pilus assembly protein CpaB
VRVSDETGVAKLIKPGDRVDVLAFTDPSGTGNKLQIETRTILQDVMVLATGKYVANTVPAILEVDPMKANSKSKLNLSEYTQFSNVTLEVDPFQAQALVFASTQLNGIYLILRNNDDNMKEELQKTRMVDLMGKDGANLQAPGPVRAPGSPQAPPRR